MTKTSKAIATAVQINYLEWLAEVERTKLVNPVVDTCKPNGTQKACLSGDLISLTGTGRYQNVSLTEKGRGVLGS